MNYSSVYKQFLSPLSEDYQDFNPLAAGGGVLESSSSNLNAEILLKCEAEIKK
jgi:hypothetical protein